MERGKAEFFLPQRLSEPALAAVLNYWQGLKRPGADVPYWDDVDMAKLSGERHRLLLLDVFDSPQRFRFAIVGASVAKACQRELEDRFVDAVPASGPLRRMAEQCRAAVASVRPTYYQDAPSGGEKGVARLLLPMWGNGQVQMLLGAVAGEVLADAA